MSEKFIKQQIIKSAEAVKKKIQNMKNNKFDTEIALETMFKPVTDPLKQLTVTHINNDKGNDDDEAYIEKSSYADEKSIENSNQEFTPSRKRRLSETDIIPSKKETRPQWRDINYDRGASDSELEQNSRNDMSEIFFETNSNAASTPNPKSISSWSLSSEVFKDVPYGIRLENGKPMVGSAPFSMTDNQFKIAGHLYNKTCGLVELLYRKKPDLNIITENDKENYKSILLNTNVHRRGYDPNQQINSNRGFKYLQIIKPLLNKIPISNHIPQGKGLPLFKKVGKKVDYVYWDDPNELVERLKLLIASRDAGNTGLDNEIISIIEELKECGVIN